ncbi:hypothetical protein SAMN05444278_1196 [Psychroflexus salarius]|uniref:Uncharacterized protein n=1 Tax=Psychroflexus salarius TaxID=1155689 RepID=A0A1M4YA94_9FLAO|nr:hypothetical protein [Psychroflexus salarius]SHF02635.1 hypothetical protein SAMN05444278_1196 [Psychroflexus salarius]
MEKYKNKNQNFVTLKGQKYIADFYIELPADDKFEIKGVTCVYYSIVNPPFRKYLDAIHFDVLKETNVDKSIQYLNPGHVLIFKGDDFPIKQFKEEHVI